MQPVREGKCPFCHSNSFHRTSRTVRERILFPFRGLAFQCDSCACRFMGQRKLNAFPSVRTTLVTTFLDWLFPARLNPRVTCRKCGAFGYKELMIRTLPYGWFCNEDERDDFAGEYRP